MNESTIKAKATRAAKAAKFRSQTVRVDDNWTILRADELNWEIRYKDKFSGYFGTLLQAFGALPAKIARPGGFRHSGGRAAKLAGHPGKD